MVDVRIKPLEWSDVRQPDEEIRYHHIIAESPIGRWTIQWKGWKDYDDRTVFLDGDFVLNGGDLLEAAKAAAQADYERRIRSTLSDAVAEREAEPAAWLISGDGIAFLQFDPTIAEADAGLLDASPLYTSPPTSELEALRKRVAELEKSRDAWEQAAYDYPDISQALIEWRSRAETAEACVAEIDAHRRKVLAENERLLNAWIERDRRVAELEEAVDGLLAPFEHDECRKDHHGYCQAHFLEEECCVATARRVREGGK